MNDMNNKKIIRCHLEGLSASEIPVKISGYKCRDCNNEIEQKAYRASAKRDLYARSPKGSRLKMTEKALSFLRLRGASDIVGIRNVITRRTSVRRGYLIEQGAQNKESLFARVTCFMRLSRRIQRMLLVMTIPVLALIFTLITTAESLAADLANEGSCGDGCLYEITTDKTGERNLVVYNVPNYTGAANIAERAFSYEVYGKQANFNKVIIKGDFENVGKESFYGNRLISEVNLPEGLKKIGRSAFSHNFNVSSLVIPDTVTDIDSHAFSFINLVGDDYSRIDSVTLPESLVRTGDYIFNNSSIGEIIIPDTLKTSGWSEKTFFNDSGSYSGITFACKGIMKECQKAMSRFISKTEGGIGSCEGKYCLNPNRISFASAGEADCKGERYWYHNGVCQLNPLTTYAKKRWTPAEANQWLNDGNDNFVVITFKK